MRGIGSECNSYLIMDSTWVLVDVGTDQHVDVLAKMLSKDKALEKVKKIVLTHTHFDHAGGVRRMSALTGADIYVHSSEGNRISAGDFSVTLAGLFGARMEPFEWSPLEEGSSIETGSAKFKILHLPGHSEGSIGLWEEKSGSLLVGDTVFAGGGIGRYDFPSGDFDDLRKSIEKIADLPVKNLYPGHFSEVIGNGADHVKESLSIVRGGAL